MARYVMPHPQILWRILSLHAHADVDAEGCAYMTGCPDALAGRLRFQFHRTWTRLRNDERALRTA